MGPPSLDSRPPYPFLTHSPSPQSKIRNTLKLKKKKNCNKAKPTASPIYYRGSSLTASPRILNQKKKKKKLQRIRKSNPSRRWQRNQTPILSIQSKSKTNSSKPNTEVFIQKKKKNPQYTNQNQTLTNQTQ